MGPRPALRRARSTVARPIPECFPKAEERLLETTELSNPRRQTDWYVVIVLVVIAAFAAGSLAMFGLKLWTEKLEHNAAASPATAGVDRGLLFATFIDVAVDGVIIGAGFAAGGETGPVLAIGLSVELLFLGLSLTSDKPGGWGIIGIGAGLGATVLLAAIVGSIVLAGTSHAVLGGVLAASAAALLYLVTEELLVEAHREPETPISTLVIFGGFLAFWCVQLLFAH